jgi:hypothetical protein
VAGVHDALAPTGASMRGLLVRVGLIDEWHVVIRKLLADFNLRRFSWDSVAEIA